MDYVQAPAIATLTLPQTHAKVHPLPESTLSSGGPTAAPTKIAMALPRFAVPGFRPSDCAATERAPAPNRSRGSVRIVSLWRFCRALDLEPPGPTPRHHGVDRGQSLEAVEFVERGLAGIEHLEVIVAVCLDEILR